MAWYSGRPMPYLWSCQLGRAVGQRQEDRLAGQYTQRASMAQISCWEFLARADGERLTRIEQFLNIHFTGMCPLRIPEEIYFNSPPPLSDKKISEAAPGCVRSFNPSLS